MEFQFGIRQRLYNWNMRVARQRFGLTQRQLGQLVGKGKVSIGQIETLRVYPKPELADEIAHILQMDVEVLFPPWLQEFKLEKVTPALEDKSISLREALREGMLDPQLLTTTTTIQDIEARIDNDALREKIETVLNELSEREKRVLILRFGLDGRRAMLLEEAGVQFNLTRERIRQIEGKALRKLRHPRYTRKLVDYLE